MSPEAPAGLGQGLRAVSARTIAEVIVSLCRGKAAAIPPSEPGEPWTVLVDPYGPGRGGGLVVLRSLWDAKPWVAGLAGLQARRAGVYGPPRPGTEGQVRDALRAVSAPEEVPT